MRGFHAFCAILTPSTRAGNGWPLFRNHQTFSNSPRSFAELVSANGEVSYQPAGNAPGIAFEKQNEGLKARAIFPNQQIPTRSRGLSLLAGWKAEQKCALL